jgi:ATP-binding cassette subfamily B protein
MNVIRLFKSLIPMGKLIASTNPLFLVAIVILQIIRGVLPTLVALISKYQFDLLSNAIYNIGPNNLSLLLGVTVIQGIIVSVNQLLSSLSNLLNARFSRQLSLRTKQLIYDKVNQFAGLTYFETPQFQDTLRITLDHSSRSPTEIISLLTIMISSVITLLTLAGLTIYFNPILGFILLLCSIPHLYLNLKMANNRFAHSLSISTVERKIGYLNQILSTAHFAKEVKVFNFGNYILSKFIILNASVNQNYDKLEIQEARSQMILDIVSNLTSIGIFFFIAITAFSRQISVGDVILYSSAITTLYNIIINFSHYIANISQHILFFQEFNNLMQWKNDWVESAQPPSMSELSQSIEVRDLSFRYSDTLPWIFKNLSFELKRGTCTAIVGINGSGKTTLVKLLSRLYEPIEGVILWDGINIQEFTPTEYRQRISVIFQDYAHYHFTVKENIGLGNLAIDFADNLVKNAALDARANDFIENLPKKYNTILSRWLIDEDESGADLSGGEWQRIAIARMLVREADLLILDEPSASLDAEAEYELYKHFARNNRNRATLLISHRLNTIQFVDKIIVLSDGKIVEQGTHMELIQKRGVYWKLFITQAKGYGEFPSTGT